MMRKGSVVTKLADQRSRLIEELRQQFHEEGCCPVCNQKKRPAYTEERRKNLSAAMKVPRNRVSPTTTRVLTAIKEAPETFTISEIAKDAGASVNTVREIARRLAIAGEVRSSGEGDSRQKTKKFGQSDFWKQMDEGGNVPLKSLPT